MDIVYILDRTEINLDAEGVFSSFQSTEHTPQLNVYNQPYTECDLRGSNFEIVISE